MKYFIIESLIYKQNESYIFKKHTVNMISISYHFPLFYMVNWHDIHETIYNGPNFKM